VKAKESQPRNKRREAELRSRSTLEFKQVQPSESSVCSVLYTKRRLGDSLETSYYKVEIKD